MSIPDLKYSLVLHKAVKYKLMRRKGSKRKLRVCLSVSWHPWRLQASSHSTHLHKKCLNQSAANIHRSLPVTRALTLHQLAIKSRFLCRREAFHIRGTKICKHCTTHIDMSRAACTRLCWIWPCLENPLQVAREIQQIHSSSQTPHDHL